VARAAGSRKEDAKGRRTPSKKQRVGKSAPNLIMALVKARKSGLDTATVRAKTGFGSQKVLSIVWELSKKHKIERMDRGLYRIGDRILLLFGVPIRIVSISGRRPFWT
jgi:hypothetical protein